MIRGVNLNRAYAHVRVVSAYRHGQSNSHPACAARIQDVALLGMPEECVLDDDVVLGRITMVKTDVCLPAQQSQQLLDRRSKLQAKVQK